VGFGIYAEAGEQFVQLLPHLGVAASQGFYLGPRGGVEFTQSILLEAARFNYFLIIFHEAGAISE
jgi:hypothetical protein